ncbi:uncharacterized protein B0H64DRAFT_433680 [Chaetomium fimeti]|uniref:Infection structure specific protein n=1 Tax=Chaetomium fimeti TaxID=1854472 RepID=A0AAE0HDV2_9PEZI|nr:hypothetical protein B0H64DRAFT_433680 [Chaetomium fimeti]
MLSQTLLLALAGAVSALPGQMQARQDSECLEAMQSVYKGMPTPAPALVSFYATQTQTDPCKMTLPPAVESAQSSLQSAASSWLAANGDGIASAAEKCPDLASLTGNIELPSCTDGASSGNTSGDDADDADDSSDDSSESNDDSEANDDTDSDSDENAGHRDTGLAAAAVAIAAFVGVVAVL